MGNQARVEDNATLFSTSTRNFNNHKAKGAQVYLGSTELAAVSALLGKIHTVEEYMAHSEADPCGIVAEKVDPFKGDLYRYLNFDRSEDFENFGRVVPESEMPKLEALV